MQYKNTQVETFLMHPTFSSKGGFRIAINGITIYQVDKKKSQTLPKIWLLHWSLTRNGVHNFIKKEEEQWALPRNMANWNQTGTLYNQHGGWFIYSGPLQIKWEHIYLLQKLGLLKANSDCDGERDSYDAMVLLTGRLDLTDVPGFYEETKEHQPSIWLCNIETRCRILCCGRN